MTKKEALIRILRLSNLDYCECSKDLQRNLEEIHDLITKEFPTLEEYTED